MVIYLLYHSQPISIYITEQNKMWKFTNTPLQSSKIELHTRNDDVVLLCGIQGFGSEFIMRLPLLLTVSLAL